MIFFLLGYMGAGKTTLIKSFCKVLDVIDEVNSPTFSIVNEYFTEKEDSIYHFDFYRIEQLEEAYDIGYEEYIDSGQYCFIEWPEKIATLLPPETVNVDLQIVENNERTIEVKV